MITDLLLQLRRSAKKASSYRDAGDSHNDDDDPATTHDQGDDDDDDDEDVDPNELDAADDDESSSVQVYVPARERATLWAKSVLKQQQESDNAEPNDTDADPNARRTVTTLAKSTRASPAARRKRSPASSSSLSSTKAARAKVEELLKKEPSQMTMGELALTVPKGKRVNRHEHEVAASEGLANAGATSGAGSSLLNPHALNRVRSFSVSSESAALGGSIVTPQVEIIDGKMVILEATVKISDVAHRRPDDDSGEHDDALPRRSGARYYAQPTTPGKRWAKDETKQFYYVRDWLTTWLSNSVAVVDAQDVKTNSLHSFGLTANLVLEPSRSELFDDGDAVPEPEAQGAQVQVQVRGEAPPRAD